MTDVPSPALPSPARASAAPPPEAELVLQGLCLPDPAITRETALFLRLSEGAERQGEAIVLPPGGRLGFDTFVNQLDLETWQGRCRLDGLWLRLAGEGRFRVELTRVTDGPLGPETELVETVLRRCEVELAAEGTVLDLADCLTDDPLKGGMVLLSLTAVGPGRFTGGAYLTRAPAASPRLAIVITTFRREAAVAATVARIADYFDGGGPGARIGRSAHVFVIDNGQSVTLPPHPRVTCIPNRNLGGAGGFARGLAAAEDGGFSHCLFMDDDASFQMENLTRCFAFLALASSPRAALAGAMISESRPWAMWEQGAIFDRLCRPLCHMTDLRVRDWAIRLELAAAKPKPAGFYGGWWFFAFPLAAVTHRPFPFFVRGDDISFSLANRFDTATLNGVVSFQEDFGAKESPQTLFLDLRNHLHHHLVQEGMEIGRWRTAGIVARFFARSLARLHYESAEAQLLSWEDVMQGPRHFAENADMTGKRAAIAGLIRQEAWSPTASPLTEPPRSLPAPLPHLAKLTLNGHLVPFWSRFARRVRIDIQDRSLLWPVWGAQEITYVDPATARSYTVRHDKRRFAALMLRALRLTLRWLRAYPALRQAYRESYPQMTSRAFWAAEFARGPAPLAGAEPARAAG